MKVSFFIFYLKVSVAPAPGVGKAASVLRRLCASVRNDKCWACASASARPVLPCWPEGRASPLLRHCRLARSVSTPGSRLLRFRLLVGVAEPVRPVEFPRRRRVGAGRWWVCPPALAWRPHPRTPCVSVCSGLGLLPAAFLLSVRVPHVWSDLT